MTVRTHVDKVWGYEDWIVNTPSYCGKKMFLKRGYACSLHYHAVKDETFYVQEGEMMVEIHNKDGQKVFHVLRPGDSLRVEPGTPHRFWGMTDTLFFEMSTHHSEEDSIRLEPSGKAPGFEEDTCR